jgi:hypothetical protein
MRLQDFNYMEARAYMCKSGVAVSSYEQATHEPWCRNPIILEDDTTGELYHAAVRTTPAKGRHYYPELDIWAYASCVELKFVPYEERNQNKSSHAYGTRAAQYATRQVAVCVHLSSGADVYVALVFSDDDVGIDLHYLYGTISQDFVAVATSLSHLLFSLWGYGPNLPKETKPRVSTIMYETLP